MTPWYNPVRGGYVSKFDKLLQRILQLDKGLRFDEVRKVLEAYGYTICTSRRQQSLHFSEKRLYANNDTKA